MTREATPHPASIVKYNLANGKTNAEAIAEAANMPLEAVYTALVWLEARGQAFLSCSRKTGAYVARWETQ